MGFARFAEETGYRTLAERPPEAADYPDADPLLLVAGSAVFRPTPHPVPLYSAECVESKSWEIRAPEMSFAHSHSGIFMRHYYM